MKTGAMLGIAGNARLSWRETRARLRRDRQRLLDLLERKFGYRPRFLAFDPSWLAVLLYRLSHHCWRRGNLKCGRLLMQLNIFLTGADIHPACELGEGLLIPSPCGVSIAGRAGADLTLMPLSGMGDSMDKGDIGAGRGLPMFADQVVLEPFTGVQGPISVGSNVRVEAGAKLVNTSVPRGTEVELVARPVHATGAPAEPRAHPDADFSCAHGRWRQTLRDFDSDIDRYLEKLFEYRPGAKGRLKILSALLTNQLLAIGIYRLSHLLYCTGWRRLSFALCRLNILFNKTTIHPASCISAGLFMPHPVGIIFNGRAGCGLTLYAGCLCVPHGAALSTGLRRAPVLGDRVTVTGQAAIIGAVSVGDDVTVAQKAQLTQDAPAGALVVTDMARSAIRHTDETHIAEARP